MSELATTLFSIVSNLVIFFDKQFLILQEVSPMVLFFIGPSDVMTFY